MGGGGGGGDRGGMESPAGLTSLNVVWDRREEPRGSAMMRRAREKRKAREECGMCRCNANGRDRKDGQCRSREGAWCLGRLRVLSMRRLCRFKRLKSELLVGRSGGSSKHTKLLLQQEG